MSQQYYYNNSQYTSPTSYAGQSVNALYPPLTSGYTDVTTGRPTLGATYNLSGPPLSSAHRSQAPVTYTYPSNATVISPPLTGVLSGQQPTLVASSLPAGQVGPTLPTFVIANGPTSAQTSLTNNGAYTVTTSYFQQLPGQNQVQQHNIAQAAVVAAAQQANFQAAMVAANSTSGRRNVFDTRILSYRKNIRMAPRSSMNSQVFYCDICKISCAGPQTYKEHLDGQKHKKKAAGNNIAPTNATKSSQRQLRCELCDITCTGVDAYQAHIRGTKHQKTFKLHQRLGKPIPCADPLVVRTASVTSSESTGTVKIVAGPIINFINSSTLKSVTDNGSSGGGDKTLSVVTDIGRVEEHVQLSSLQDKSLAPIGNEYIETTVNETGKIIQYSCKLCSCKFSDPHAKEMHLKGKRHRLQYKKKVDPSLVIEGKIGSSRNSKILDEQNRQKQQREEFWRRRDMQSRIREMQRLEYSNITYANQGGHGGVPLVTLDDKHVMCKHSTIYPSDEELQVVQSVVINCEKALRHISELLFDDTIKNKEAVISTDDGNNPTTTQETVTDVVGTKLLIGAMRVGPLAKSLLLRGEMVVSLVLLCSKWPTFPLVAKVVDKLSSKLQELLPNDNMEVTLNTDYQCILVSRKKTPEMHCYIHFTSSMIREQSANGVVAVQPEDGLDRKRCLDALASLRHTKWFQAKVTGLQPCLILIRIVRDLCRRVPTWTPLSCWAVELLIEKLVSSDSMKLSPGCTLRRLFECIASGILLSGGPGLRDPCEKEISDASAVLSAQDREDITASAQHAVRLIAFRQIHTVLDMEPLKGALGTELRAPVVAVGEGRGGVESASARKRQHSGDTGDEVVTVGGTLKKEKKELAEAKIEAVSKSTVVTVPS